MRKCHTCMLLNNKKKLKNFLIYLPYRVYDRSVKYLNDQSHFYFSPYSTCEGRVEDTEIYRDAGVYSEVNIFIFMFCKKWLRRVYFYHP